MWLLVFILLKYTLHNVVRLSCNVLKRKVAGKEKWPEKKGGLKIKVAGKDRWPENRGGRRREVAGEERWPEKKDGRKRKVAGKKGEGKYR